MSLMTEHEVKCMIDDALKEHMDKYVASVRPYNGDTQSISIVMSDGNVITMDVSGLIADVLSKTKDVHVVAWTEYNPADNTGQLLMSNGTKVPVDLSAVIADAIASIVFPEIPKGLDCEAVGNLPKRAYKTGDSVLVHGTDGVCARVETKPGIFTDVRVSVVARQGYIYVNASTDVITTVQNLAQAAATVRVTLSNPSGTTYELGEPVIEKDPTTTVTKQSDNVYLIENLTQGSKVIITRPVKALAKGSYGFSANLTIADGNIFDYSTTDDYSAVNITVAEASTGTPTTSCPLVKLYSPDRATELPVKEYPNYVPEGSNYFYPGSNENSFVILTDDTGYVDLPIEGATTALAHAMTVKQSDPPPFGKPIFIMSNNTSQPVFDGDYLQVSSNIKDEVGIVLDVANKKLKFPAPPVQAGSAATMHYKFIVELKAGPTCSPQIITGIVFRKSDVKPVPGVASVTPTTGISVVYDYAYGLDVTTGFFVVDKTGVHARGRVTTGLRKATVTIPKGLAYTGVANLTGQTTAQSSTGNITLVGSGNLADNKITIDVKSTATAIDTIKEFAGLLTINTTD